MEFFVRGGGVRIEFFVTIQKKLFFGGGGGSGWGVRADVNREVKFL